MSRRPPEGTQAILRAIGLLKAFSHRRTEMGLAELCETVGLTKTTAHRLLAALESEGLVTHNRLTHAYRLGPAAIAMGSVALGSYSLRAIVNPELERLARETEETSSLEVVAHGGVLIASAFSGSRLISVSADVGTVWPLHATSTGKVILADMTAEERVRLLDLPLARHTDATITDPAVFDRELEKVRERGWAIAVEELEVGAVAVASPLRDAGGKTVGAISLGGPVSRLGKRRLAELGKVLKSTAEGLAPRIEHGG